MIEFLTGLFVFTGLIVWTLIFACAVGVIADRFGVYK